MSLPLILAAAALSRFADPDAIDRAVGDFVMAAGAPAGSAAPVDRRLRLVPCGAPLMLGWRTARQDAVLVTCPDADGWRLMVPLRAPLARADAAPMVNRGDGVAIVVTGDGFDVSRSGQALEAGAVGAWIRVRPDGQDSAPAAAPPLRAQIVRPGLVTVPIS